MFLLSTAYLPPIQYFCKLVSGVPVLLEAHEHYHKQSYRNRSTILSANGVLDLSIPVVKQSGAKMPIRDVRIDYSSEWQRSHWRAMVAAYNASPFFMYYADDLQPFYERQETFLFDYNLQLIHMLAFLIGFAPDVRLTQRYQAYDSPALDFRESISPKKTHQAPDKFFAAEPYYQVFDAKYGFTPNLSVVDLLFNEGPNALSVLKQCIRP